MSIFSFLSKGRQAAKEHKAAKAEQEKKEAVKPPYKHIPSHAAVDAMSGAPAAFRSDDRPRILEAHKRRSAIFASQSSLNIGVGASPMHQSGMGSRTHSTLSHVSYPASHANPKRVPRAYSYGSAPTGWHYNGGEVSYGGVDATRQYSGSIKGKEVDRSHTIDSGVASKMTSKANSPAGSSAESISSQEELEMRSARPQNKARPASFMPTKREQMHRLHPNSGSKPPSVHRADNNAPPSAYRSSSRHSVKSIRGMESPSGRPAQHSAATDSYFAPSLPPMQVANSALPPPTAAATMRPVKVESARASIRSHRKHDSPPSSLSKVVSHSSSDESTTSSTERQARASYVANQAQAVPAPQAVYKSRRASSQPGFSALEPISSVEPHHLPTNEKSRQSVQVTALPTEFDDSNLVQPMRAYSHASAQMEPTQYPADKEKNGRLFKSNNGAKPAKKHRWSMRSSQPSAVAF